MLVRVKRSRSSSPPPHLLLELPQPASKRGRGEVASETLSGPSSAAAAVRVAPLRLLDSVPAQRWNCSLEAAGGAGMLAEWSRRALEDGPDEPRTPPRTRPRRASGSSANDGHWQTTGLRDGRADRGVAAPRDCAAADDWRAKALRRGRRGRRRGGEAVQLVHVAKRQRLTPPPSVAAAPGSSVFTVDGVRLVATPEHLTLDSLCSLEADNFARQIEEPGEVDTSSDEDCLWDVYALSRDPLSDDPLPRHLPLVQLVPASPSSASEESGEVDTSSDADILWDAHAMLDDHL